MPSRRILSLWFPRLAAERYLRTQRGVLDVPFAIVGDRGNVTMLVSLSEQAIAAGLSRGQPVRDARAMCPALVTRFENPQAEADFLAALQRWAGKFSPWVAAEGGVRLPPDRRASEGPDGVGADGLVADLTGCAHLFGGEAGLLRQVEEDCADLGLTIRAGIADTLGAAWALARHGTGDDVGSGSGGAGALRSGDAIDQEARATRSRAAKRRHWERGGAPPELVAAPVVTGRIAPPGQMRTVLAPLPVGALRLPENVTAQLARLGLRRIEDLANQPRAGLARRFGQQVVLRLDQALGMVPEPVSPAAAPPRFAVRLTLPEPIALEEDVAAGLDRLLPALSARLMAKGQGARRVRLRVERTDHTAQWVEVGLARPSADPERLRPLLRMKLGDLEAGDGIDVLRLEAYVTEPVHAMQHRGQLEVSQEVRARTAGAGAPPSHAAHGGGERASGAGPGAATGDAGKAASERVSGLGGAATEGALDDLISRLGARIGLERILRLYPGDSHIPEKTTQVRAAAWAEPARDWQVSPPVPRPLTIFRPEPVYVPEPVFEARTGGSLPRGAPGGGSSPGRRPPPEMRWRRQALRVVSATGPERIAPEWWLDEPEWRSGVRDYWQVEVQTGERLWLFYAHGAGLSAGWFCHGLFA
ncbi:MAG: DNA polymerase Y family protein [Pseudomonadota bacterium]